MTWVSHHFVTGWMSVAGIGDGSGRLSDGKNLFLKIASVLVIYCLFTSCPFDFGLSIVLVDVSGISISVTRSSPGKM